MTEPEPEPEPEQPIENEGSHFTPDVFCPYTPERWFSLQS